MGWQGANAADAAIWSLEAHIGLTDRVGSETSARGRIACGHLYFSPENIDGNAE